MPKLKRYSLSKDGILKEHKMGQYVKHSEVRDIFIELMNEIKNPKGSSREFWRFAYQVLAIQLFRQISKE